MLIDYDWCCFMLIDSDWCWLILISVCGAWQGKKTFLRDPTYAIFLKSRALHQWIFVSDQVFFVQNASRWQLIWHLRLASLLWLWIFWGGRRGEAKWGRLRLCNIWGDIWANRGIYGHTEDHIGDIRPVRGQKQFKSGFKQTKQARKPRSYASPKLCPLN